MPDQPDRRPWPCSARRTQWRSLSPEQPIFSAIEWIADHWEVCSAWWSRTIRTARARTSGEYGGTRFVMAPSSQELEPPGNPARFNGVADALSAPTRMPGRYGSEPWRLRALRHCPERDQRGIEGEQSSGVP